MNGTALDATFDNYEALDTILAFNHNAEVEGNNTLMIGYAWKRTDGVTENALCGTSLNAGIFSGSIGFCMNPATSEYSSGHNDSGWEMCEMRTIAMPALEEVMDPKERVVIAEHTVYTSNGPVGTHNAVSYVTPTRERMYLLAEWEVFEKCSYANPDESKYQKQIPYFQNGTIRMVMGWNNTSYVDWWERSSKASNKNGFCYVNSNGVARSGVAYAAWAIRPVYCIA